MTYDLNTIALDSSLRLDVSRSASAYRSKVKALAGTADDKAEVIVKFLIKALRAHQAVSDKRCPSPALVVPAIGLIRSELHGESFANAKRRVDAVMRAMVRQGMIVISRGRGGGVALISEKPVDLPASKPAPKKGARIERRVVREGILTPEQRAFLNAFPAFNG